MPKARRDTHFNEKGNISDAGYAQAVTLRHSHTSWDNIAAALNCSPRGINKSLSRRVPPSKRPKRPPPPVTKLQRAKREQRIVILHDIALRLVPLGDRIVRGVGGVKSAVKQLVAEFPGARAVMRRYNQHRRRPHTRSLSGTRRLLAADGGASAPPVYYRKCRKRSYLSEEDKRCRVRMSNETLPGGQIQPDDQFVFLDETTVQADGRSGAPGAYCLKGEFPEGNCKMAGKGTYVRVHCTIGPNYRHIVELLPETAEEKAKPKAKGDRYGAHRFINDVLKPQLRFFKRKNIIVVLDNDGSHTATKVVAFFKNHHIRVLRWSPRSADMNPVENIFPVLKGRTSRSGVWQKAGLAAAVIKIFNAIEWSTVNNLVNSFRPRLNMVRAAEGAWCKY